MTATETTERGGRARRAPILAVVIVMLGAGVAAGRAHVVRSAGSSSPVDASARPPAGALSTAWYCPGLPTTFPTRDQTVTLSNVGSSDAEAIVTVYPDRGSAAVIRSVTVPRDTVRTFDRATLTEATGRDISGGTPQTSPTTRPGTPAPGSLPTGPIVVEPLSPDVVVEAGIETDNAFDAVACANTASADWYFAAGTTVRGVSQWLVLDDPFSTDARVDISLRSDSGLQLLPALQGIDVPGRSRVVVPIHDHAVRQARVAVEVHAAVGKVVASQTLQFGPASGPTGVATTLGALAPASHWWFTDGRASANATQWVALSDLGPLDAHVVVQALTGSQGIVPPVVLTVASGDVSWVQIGGCATPARSCLLVPPNRGYELVVSVDGKVPIVAQTLSRFDDRKTGRGATTSMGSTTPARRWIVARTREVGERSTSISLMNPGVRSPAHVSVEVLHSGVVDRPDALQRLTVAPSARLELPVTTTSSSARDDAAFVVTSDAPIFVESTIYAPGDSTRAPGVAAR